MAPTAQIIRIRAVIGKKWLQNVVPCCINCMDYRPGVSAVHSLPVP